MKYLVVCTLLAIMVPMIAADTEGDTRNKSKREQHKTPPKSPKSPKTPVTVDKTALATNLSKLAGLSSADAIEISNFNTKS